MKSRKGTFLALAEAKSANLLGSLPEGRRRARVNLEAIWVICRALVQRATPIAPTAKLVSEEGRNRNPEFPSAQTIYNEYREMLAIWRKAYTDILNIDARDPISLDQLEKIDVSELDEGTRFIVDELRQHVRELVQRCNALKQIIAESVPMPAGSLTDSSDKVMDELAEWLEDIERGPFDLDDIGLRVSRRTPPNTVVMHTDLFKALRTIVDGFRRGRRAASTN